MNVTKRELALGAAAAALVGARGEAEAAGPVARYPAPIYLPSPKGTSWIAPRIPAYPQPNVPQARLFDDARRLSDALEAHIRGWLDGRAPDRLPADVLPPGFNARDFPSWSLIAEADVNPETQWAVRPAHAIERDALHGAFPDPNCSYLVAQLYAPFGATLEIAGEFPHARFFDIQVTPAFDPRSYRYDGWAGVGETPLVDADIEPLPGHVNPYRVGARRDARNRSFVSRWTMAIGDPTELDPAFRPPFFRARGETRFGSGIMYQGPYADQRGQGHKRGRWDHGSIWVRYYRPDYDRGPMAGVAPPRLLLSLPEEKRRFWLAPDFRPFVARANRKSAPKPTSPKTTPLHGPNAGWSKQAGILRAIYSGFAISTNWGSKDYVRAFDRGAAARGADLPPPNNYEQSATSCTYIDYLVRTMECAQGRVVVLTGKLPLIPRTGDGAPVMTRGEARYWSLTGYVIPEGWDMLGAFLDPTYVAGLAAHCVSDEDVVLQADRRYVIALSRPEDRPANARPEAGVTWADWGLAGTVSWTLRWMTVGPEWTAANAPTPAKLGRRAEWAEPDYDPTLLANNHEGIMGAYLPRVHYLAREEFEALGPVVAPDRVPIWRS